MRHIGQFIAQLMLSSFIVWNQQKLTLESKKWHLRNKLRIEKNDLLSSNTTGHLLQ